MKVLRFGSKELVSEDGLDNGHILDSFINLCLPNRIYSTELISSYLLISKTEPDLEFYRDYREVFPLAGSYNPYRIKDTKIEREIRICESDVLGQNNDLSSNPGVFKVYTYLSEQIYRLNIGKIKSTKLPDYWGSYEIYSYENALKFDKFNPEIVELLLETAEKNNEYRVTQLFKLGALYQNL